MDIAKRLKEIRKAKEISVYRLSLLAFLKTLTLTKKDGEPQPTVFLIAI